MPAVESLDGQWFVGGVQCPLNGHEVVGHPARGTARAGSPCNQDGLDGLAQAFDPGRGHPFIAQKEPGLGFPMVGKPRIGEPQGGTGPLASSRRRDRQLKWTLPKGGWDPCLDRSPTPVGFNGKS